MLYCNDLHPYLAQILGMSLQSERHARIHAFIIIPRIYKDNRSYLQTLLLIIIIICSSYIALFLAEASLALYILLPLADLSHPSPAQLPGEYTPAHTL